MLSWNPRFPPLQLLFSTIYQKHFCVLSLPHTEHYWDGYYRWGTQQDLEWLGKQRSQHACEGFSRRGSLKWGKTKCEGAILRAGVPYWIKRTKKAERLSTSKAVTASCHHDRLYSWTGSPNIPSLHWAALVKYFVTARSHPRDYTAIDLRVVVY